MSQAALTATTPPDDAVGAVGAARPGVAASENYCPRPAALDSGAASARVPWSGSRKWWFCFALGLLLACAALFVLSDVIQTCYFPNLSVAWRHLLLTTRAAVVTGGGCAVVYVIMRRAQWRIEATADELAARLESYRGDRRDRTYFANPHRMRCSDVLGCTRTECPVYHVDDQPCWRQMALSRASGNGHGPRVSIRQCHECPVYLQSCPDGLTRLGESFNSLLFMLDEEATELHRMQSQMVEKEKMIALGQLAAGIAHEISNPLSSISSVVQMLKRRGPDGRSEHQFDLIQTHIQRITDTVRQLSTLARPSIERWEHVDLWPALEDAVTLVAFDRRARSVTIERIKPVSLPKTYALKHQLQQVFINLLLNALDAMPDGGVLTVSAAAQGRSIYFSIADTGHGIPSEVGRRVFEPFFTTKAQGFGSGLGLAVSYGIVQKHGGSMEFAPRDGGGTVFTVEIPITNSAPEA